MTNYYEVIDIRLPVMSQVKCDKHARNWIGNNGVTTKLKIHLYISERALLSEKEKISERYPVTHALIENCIE